MSLNRDLESLRADLVLPETEETWDRIANSVDVLTDLCQNGACDSPQVLIPALKSFSRPLISALNSERTRLSGPAVDLIATVANGLGPDFDPLLSIFFPALLLLCSRTNKVVVSRAKACALSIVQSTQLPSILPHLLQHSKDKTSSLRLVVAECTLACLNCFNPPDLERESRARDIESIIRVTAKDAAADVRKVGRDIFKAYTLLLPTRVKSFIAPLSPTTKKYLDVKLSDLTDSDVKPKSRLAASTSSVSARPVRPIGSIAPERPKSSLACRTDDYKASKKADLDARPQSAFQYRSAPQVTQHRHEARRVPVLTAERIPTGHTTSSQVVHPMLVMAYGRVGDPQFRPTAASTGPKRIPLPEAPPASLTVSRANDIAHATLSNINSTTTSGSRDHKSLNVDPKKVIDNKTTDRLPNSLTSSGPLDKTASVPRRPTTQRGVSQPTQSQLAKTRPATSKPAVTRKALHKPMVPKTTGRKLACHQPNNKKVQAEPKTALPTSRTATPENRDLPEASQAKESVPALSEDAEEEARTELESECETPKRAPPKDLLIDKTPISALLTSIEQGFLFTPSSPLSPPQMYVDREIIIEHQPFPLRIAQKDIVRTGQPELPKADLKDEGQRQVLGIVEINSSS